MRRGEVWEVAGGAKVLVASSDEFNGEPDEWPWVASISRRRGSADRRAWAVDTGELDPVSGGTVQLHELDHLEVERALRRVGMLTGATMSEVDDGLRALFDLAA